jgi:hypothetical protein
VAALRFPSAAARRRRAVRQKFQSRSASTLRGNGQASVALLQPFPVGRDGRVMRLRDVPPERTPQRRALAPTLRQAAALASARVVDDRNDAAHGLQTPLLRSGWHQAYLHAAAVWLAGDDVVLRGATADELFRLRLDVIPLVRVGLDVERVRHAFPRIAPRPEF